MGSVFDDCLVIPAFPPVRETRAQRNEVEYQRTDESELQPGLLPLRSCFVLFFVFIIYDYQNF